jgi:type VI protein secretion system component VasF
MPGPDANRPEPGADAGLDDIQADIEQTREQLGETVEALQAKLDVKARAQDKVAETKQQVVQRRVPIALVLGAVVVGVLIWRRRR